MADDPDAMWRPGYEPAVADRPDDPTPDLRIDVAPVDPAETQPSPPGPVTAHHESVQEPVEILVPGLATTSTDAVPAEVSRPRKPWRRSAALLLLVVIAGGAMAANLRDDQPTDRPTVGDVTGADARRLPTSAGQLWSTTVAVTDDANASDVRYLVDGRTTVAAVVPTTGGTAIGIGLDAMTGEERWRRAFDFAAPSVDLLGVLDGTLVIEQNDLTARRLLGVDIATGDTEWSLSTRDNGVHVILSGTDVVTRVSFTGNERLTFIDPATGEEAARLDGRLIGTELSGTWFVESGRRIMAIDLSDGPSTPIEIDSREAGWTGPTAIVDGRVIVVDVDGALAEALPGQDELVPVVIVGGNLPDVASLVATGGPTFMAIGDGRVLGLQLAGTDAEVVWNLPASVRVVDVSTQGLLVALSDATNGFVDGADIAVVDPVTGDQLASSGPAPSVADLPQLLGDGFVITNDAPLGLERIGYDLDGEEVWRLPNNDPIQVGDRIVVAGGVAEDGFTLTAFGDPE